MLGFTELFDEFNSFQLEVKGENSLIDLHDYDTPHPYGCPWLWAGDEIAVSAAEWIDYYKSEIEERLAEEDRDGAV